MKKRMFVATVLVLAAASLAGAWVPASRFTDNGNGTVSDNVTGLMWQQTNDTTKRTWQASINYCDALSLAGHSDWRLPNVKQLSSLVDEGTYDPAINTAKFPGTASGGYWSSTSYTVDTAYAWLVYFDNGHVYDGNKGHGLYARCVRP